MIKEFKLPEMGEGIESGDVVSMLVKAGDTIEPGDTVCELETSKALIEVPSDLTGTVKEVHFGEGDSIPVGETILTVEVEDAAAEEATEPEPENEKKADGDETEEKPQDDKEEEARKEEPDKTSDGPDSRPAKQQQASSQAPPTQTRGQRSGDVAPAGPATRRFARELGVDIGDVPGSGPDGRVTRDDVRSYVGQAMAGGAQREPELPDFSDRGRVEIIQPGKVKELTAEHMALAWSAIPHVTQFEDADITDLEKLRQRSSEQARERGGKLTLTVLVLKALIPALKEFPEFNASRDPQTGELVYKKYYDIGIATATDRGLLVPVICGVDKKTILDLSVELAELAERTREGKAGLDELKGSTFSLSNQGGIGGSHFTPIVNHPESAILAVGRGRIMPGYSPLEAKKYQSGETDELKVTPRLMLPIAVSYDHRIVDGAQAAAFIRAVKETLEDPNRLLLGL